MVFGLIASREDMEYAGIIHQITFRGDPREAIEEKDNLDDLLVV